MAAVGQKQTVIDLLWKANFIQHLLPSRVAVQRSEVGIVGLNQEIW
jgi:hypothetical protein